MSLDGILHFCVWVLEAVPQVYGTALRIRPILAICYRSFPRREPSKPSLSRRDPTEAHLSDNLPRRPFLTIIIADCESVRYNQILFSPRISFDFLFFLNKLIYILFTRIRALFSLSLYSPLNYLGTISVLFKSFLMYAIRITRRE